MAVAQSFISLTESLFIISLCAGVAGVLWVVLGYKSPIFMYSHAFFVYSRQLLAWRNASTVARAL